MFISTSRDKTPGHSPATGGTTSALPRAVYTMFENVRLSEAAGPGGGGGAGVTVIVSVSVSAAPPLGFGVLTVILATPEVEGPGLITATAHVNPVESGVSVSRVGLSVDQDTGVGTAVPCPLASAADTVAVQEVVIVAGTVILTFVAGPRKPSR